MIYLHRRIALAILTTFALPASAFAQLLKTVYSEETPTIDRLSKAQSLEEVMQIAAEWDEVYRDQAGSLSAEYKTDYQKIVDAVTDEITGIVRDETGKAALRVVAPKLLAILEAVASYFEVLSPIFVAIEVLSPSETASDAYEIQQTDVRVQKAIRDAISRFVDTPSWYDTIRHQITMPEPGPTLRQG